MRWDSSEMVQDITLQHPVIGNSCPLALSSWRIFWEDMIGENNSNEMTHNLVSKSGSQLPESLVSRIQTFSVTLKELQFE